MPEIAIDACIFINLFDTRENVNKDGHVDKVLSYYLLGGYQLLLDSKGKIGSDFQKRILPILTKGFEEGTKLPLLRQWMMPERHDVVELDVEDLLMKAIRKIIYEPSEGADRAFVYVALRADTDLISSDDEHILSRRKDLMKSTKKLRGDNADIITSREAYEGIA